MKLKFFASTALAAAASLLMTATPASAQNYGFNNHRGGSDVVLYEHGNFRGRVLPVDGAINNLDRFRFNDATSSIEVRRGRWEVCSDGNFRGSCQIVDASISNLNYLRLNDAVSSIRPVNGYGQGYGNHRNDGWGRRGRDNDRGWNNRDQRDWGHRGNSRYGGLVVYEHANFGGWSVPIDSDVYDLGPLRINNQISSMQVTSGRWLVCSEIGYRGHCETINGTVNSANYLRLNDQISSIRRIG